MTAAQEFAYMSIEELAGKIQRRDVSPVEVTQAMLDRVEQLEPRSMLLIPFSKMRLSKLHERLSPRSNAGPIVAPCTASQLASKTSTNVGQPPAVSQSLEHYVAEKDCTSVAKLKEAGALVLGKTATYEFAYGFPTKTVLLPAHP